ncbi:MAG: class II fructose-bisphosphate aldolase [Oscillospiraceae bacterium]|nr:class II fructose-bisphosphate aldolase [Oscillospiraceae bacterium]
MKYIEALNRARRKGRALGAFNIFNAQSIRAAAEAAKEAETEIIIQTSVKTVKYFGIWQLASLMRALCRDCPYDVFLHLDHCREVEFACKCVDAGWDSVMLDGSALPLEQNIEMCAAVSSYAHEHGVAVEGELGRVMGVEEEIEVSEEVGRTSFEDCFRFLEESGIDSFAPGVGTAHGVYKGEPEIDFELVEQLAAASDIPIVIHGGTGLSKEVFRRLISLGASKINVSTALKGAYYEGIKDFLKAEPAASEPLALDTAASEAIKRAVLEHLLIFGGK